MKLYINFLKYVIDRIVAFFVLLLTSPVILILIILLSIEFKGKPFFLQPRIGYKNKVFKLFKFRKMTDETDEHGHLLPEEQRLTKIGKFIRRSSLDEIPQFINILIGQMSLIGPRPFLAEYYNYYTPRELHRHDVRPGLTSWAAVQGRVKLDWNKRFELDLEYIEKMSFLFDLKIFLYTFKTVFFTYKNPIYDPLKVLPLLTEYRAFIRMINKNDDLNKISELLSKSYYSFFKQKNKFSLEKLIRENYLHQQFLPDRLLLIDDYNGTYNSFMYFEIVNNNTAKIKDFFISKNCFLDSQQMFEKYKSVAQKYFEDFGYKNIKILN